MSNDWSGRRAQAALTHVLNRDKGICWICGHPGADSLDHIVPRSVAPERTWDETNWAAAHGSARPEYDCPGQYARGDFAGPRRPAAPRALITVVMGPPTAGKTTYVQHNAKPGDLIVDTDAIALALGAKPGHTTAGLHAGFARSCRSHVITTVLTKGAEVPTWIIDTAPTIAAIEHYTRASAHPHLIDPGKGTCLQRARTRGKGTTPAILVWYTHHHDRLTAWTHTTPTPPAPTTTATREW